MKHIFFSLAAFFLVLCLTGCSTGYQKTGVPGKVVVLPAKPGEKSLPAGAFISLGKLWASEQTEVYAELKDDTIKFEFVCYGNTKDLEWSAKKPTDDMTLFGGEHVELLIAPRGVNDGGRYYHLALNPAGSLYDAKYRDTKWEMIGNTKTEIKKDCWIASFELKHIAFTLDKTGATGSEWNINFCRTIKKKGKEAEHSSWTGSSNFHSIPTMGLIQFSGSEPTDHLRIFKCSQDTDGNLALEIGKTGKEHAFLQIFSNGELVHNRKLSGTKTLKINCELKKQYISMKGTKNISIYLLGPYRIPIQSFSANLVPAEDDLLILDKFEYINDKNLICKTTKFPGKAEIKKDQKLIREHAVTEKETKINLNGLEPGRYVLEYSWEKNRTSRIFFIAPEKTVETPELPQKGKLAVNGKNLKFDGKPFYLLGISGGSETHFPVPPGFTLNYGKGFRKNALPYRGIPGRRYVRKPASGYAYFKNWESMVTNHFEKLKKEDKSSWNLLCYEASLSVLHTKPDGSLEVDPEGHLIYKKIYGMAKKIAPGSVFSIQVDNLDLLKNYTDCSDILEYAGWNSSYHRVNMIENFGKDFDFVRNLAPEKPLVVWLGGSIPNAKCRTAEEIRAGVYYTILKGGAGNIIHMGHGGIPKERTRFWSMLSMLQREVDSFFPELKTWKEINLKLPENIIGKAVAGPAGESLIVLLNLTDSELVKEIELPGIGKKTLTFTPFEPMVFRAKPQIKGAKADKKADNPIQKEEKKK